MYNIKKNIAIIFIFPFLLESCSFQREVISKVVGSDLCASKKIEIIYNYPTDSKILEIMNHPLLTDFSKKSIQFSIAYDFYLDLIKLKTLEKEEVKKDSFSNAYLFQKQKVLQQIYFAQADISAMESEIHCYEDRFSETIINVKEIESDIVQKNSFFAILTGGIGTLLDGASADNPSINKAVILVSGIVISVFSYLAYDPIVKIEFSPKSTILKDLWNNPQKSKSFTDPIWFLLSREYNTDEKSIREILKEQWEKNGYLGKDDANRARLTNIYFGNGGLCSIREYENRKEMLSETLVKLDLFQQIIRTFQYEVLFGKVK